MAPKGGCGRHERRDRGLRRDQATAALRLERGRGAPLDAPGFGPAAAAGRRRVQGARGGPAAARRAAAPLEARGVYITFVDVE